MLKIRRRKGCCKTHLILKQGSTANALPPHFHEAQLSLRLDCSGSLWDYSLEIKITFSFEGKSSFLCKSWKWDANLTYSLCIMYFPATKREDCSIVAVIGKVKLWHFFWKGAMEKLRDLSSVGVGDANRTVALVLLSWFCLSTVVQDRTCTSDVVVKSVVGMGSYGEDCFHIIFSTTHHSALNSKESTRADEMIWPSLNQYQKRIKIIQLHFYVLN